MLVLKPHANTASPDTLKKTTKLVRPFGIMPQEP